MSGKSRKPSDRAVPGRPFMASTAPPPKQHGVDGVHRHGDKFGAPHFPPSENLPPQARRVAQQKRRAAAAKGRLPRSDYPDALPRLEDLPRGVARAAHALRRVCATGAAIGRRELARPHPGLEGAAPRARRAVPGHRAPAPSGLMRALEPELPEVAPWTQRGLTALRYLTGRGLCTGHAHANGRRFVILHLDGVSKKRLERGMADGTLPRLRDFLARGDYGLSPLYAGSPSSTPSFQAGLLWGTRADTPGFLWYDKRRGRIVSMNSKVDAARVEDEVCAGRRGLLEDGTTYFSLFTGGSRVTPSRSPAGRATRCASMPAPTAGTWPASLPSTRSPRRAWWAARSSSRRMQWPTSSTGRRRPRASITSASSSPTACCSRPARETTRHRDGARHRARRAQHLLPASPTTTRSRHRRGPDSRQALRALEATDARRAW